MLQKRGFCKLGIAVVLLFSLPVFSSSAPAPVTISKLDEYFKESWTTRDGLPHNTINSIKQTADGYLWLATWEGVVRYNGRQFTTLGRDAIPGLPDAGIRVLALDNDGSLLIGGARGVLARVHHNQWTGWPAMPVLINDVVPLPDGRLWVATEGEGVFLQYPDGQRQHFSEQQGLPNNNVYSLFIDANNVLWVGTASGLVFITPELQLVSAGIEGLPDSPVFEISAGNEQEILLGTGQGLFRIEEYQAELLLPELADISVSELLVTPEAIWIGTVDHGLMRFSSLGLERLNIETGLPNNRILSLFLDREKSLWVGTNGGLFRLRDAPFTTYTAEKGLADNYVRAVLSHSDGGLWIGTSRGLSRMYNRQLSSVDLREASRGQSILSLAEDARDGSLWIGTYSDGLLHWQHGRVLAHYHYGNGLASNEVRAIQPQPDGSVWVGTANGLNRLHQGNIELYGTEQGLPGNFIMSLLQSRDGRLFIGTGVGVAVMQDGNIKALDLSELDDAENAFGFAEDIQAGLLWITTDRGLISYRLEDGFMTMIGREAGMPFDKLFQLVIDRQQFFWITTNRGVIRVARQQVLDVVSGRSGRFNVELFGESDGMESAQANGGSGPAATLHIDGSVWVATSAGVSTLNPEKLKRFSAVVPPVVIEELLVDSRFYDWQQNVPLPAGSNRLELKFAGLGFIMPQRIQYRTRLEGFDQDWVERGTLNFAEYTNLPPGQYRFRVSASYPQGAWSSEEAVLEFTIAPFWWQRSGFWLLLAMLAIGLTILSVRLRLARLRRSELRLKRLVARKTAELQQQADELRAANTEKSKLVEQLRLQSEAFEQQARVDGLTGLANRRAFDEALHHEYMRAGRSQRPLSLVLLDIDHFKQVNDSWSHSIGDEVLKCVAREIECHCRQTDTVARWGGEEFAILLPDTSLQQAAEMSERLRKAVSAINCDSFAQQLRVTVSIGIAVHTGTLHPRELLSKADEALYKAKQAGRDQVVLTY